MKLQGKRVGVLVEEGFEDLEFWVPVMRLREEGAEVIIIGTGRQDVFHGKHCLEARPDVAAAEVDANTLDGLVVPGGWGPDKLRRFDAVLDLVRALEAQGKIIASICHGGWVLASAGVLKGRKATGSRGIRDDMVNAGAEWIDAPAFRDGNHVWGRVVADIPAFCRELIAALAE
ncbi:MAG TPA: type 1 glutamine amidotransferase [Chloroflexi bacterium]|nr:type 1 glutamine amidotransferase [Chloroflexota bacterium]